MFITMSVVISFFALLRLKLRVFSLKKLLVLLLTLSLLPLCVFVVFFLLGEFTVIDFRYDSISKMTNRTFDFLQILSGTDDSRSSTYVYIFEYLNSTNFLFHPLGESTPLYKNDSGLVFVLWNFGIIFAISAVFVLFLNSLSLRNSMPSYGYFMIPIVFLTILASEAFMLPRLYCFPLPSVLLYFAILQHNDHKLRNLQLYAKL